MRQIEENTIETVRQSRLTSFQMPEQLKLKREVQVFEEAKYYDEIIEQRGKQIDFIVQIMSDIKDTQADMNVKIDE